MYKQVNRKKQTDGSGSKVNVQAGRMCPPHIQEEHKFNREGRVPVDHMLSAAGVCKCLQEVVRKEGRFYVVRMFVSAHLSKYVMSQF